MFISVYFGRVFQINVSHEPFHIHDVIHHGLVKFQENEGAIHPHMRSYVHWNDLERDFRQLGDLDYPRQLGAHHGGPADGTAQGLFIEEAAKERAAVLLEQSLPFDPGFKTPLNGGVIQRRLTRFEDRASVAFNLEESCHQIGVEVADRGGLGLQADVGRIGQVEFLPPGALLSFPCQGDQPVAFGCVRDLVQNAEIADVAWTGASATGLQPTELGGGKRSLSLTSSMVSSRSVRSLRSKKPNSRRRSVGLASPVTSVPSILSDALRPIIDGARCLGDSHLKIALADRDFVAQC